MASLPNDVIERILIGLPVFDLVRCKGVCKDWRSLISSANFVAAHLERAKSDPSSHHLLVVNGLFRRPAAGPFSSFTCFSSKDLFIVGSVNGLICIAGKPFGPLSPDDIWILNPVTGLSRKLPYSSRLFFDKRGYCIKLAFWCDDDDAVYNVARILTDIYGKSTLELWVSTSPDTWTLISTSKIDIDLDHPQYHACDVLIQGLAAYWIVVRSQDVDDYGDDYEAGNGYESDDAIIVVSLDLKTLALNKFMPLSKGRMRKGYLFLEARIGNSINPCLFCGNLNGEFVLVGYSAACGIFYGIWFLTKAMDDTLAERWIEKFTLCFKSFPFQKCLGIVNDKLVLTSCRDMIVALCDPVAGRLEVVEISSKLKTIDVSSACGFVGSLVSIHGFGFEWNDLLRKYMGIKWKEEGWRLNSGKKQTRKEEGWRMESCKKQRI